MQTILIRTLYASGLSAAFFIFNGADGAEIGVNAIQNFGTCAGGLSHTVADAAGFQDHRPGDIGANFFFADDNVWLQDWTTADFSSSSDTTTGFAGADSNMITYLSSHGDSSGGVFYGSLAESQSCSFNNSSMALGDSKNRYLFLSTCYGLMLGTGQYLPEHPAHSAEDLQQVWNKGLSGTRCIFSYGTVSADNPNYGKFFWERWKQEGMSNSNAFMNASWAISTRQQPVVMCFGHDANDANSTLDETVFNYNASGYGYNVWTWFDPVASRTQPDPSLRSADAPRRIRFARATAADAAHAFPNIPRRAALKTNSFSREAPRSTLALENIMTTPQGWRYLKPSRSGLDERRSARVSSNREAIQVARSNLKTLRLHEADDALKVAYVRQQKVASTDHPEPFVINRTVAFEQKIAGGYSMLGHDGKIFVSVDASGDIRELEDTRIKSVATAELPRDAGATVTLQDAPEALMALAQKRWPGARILEAPWEVGYLADGRDTARLMVRMAFTATKEGFSKGDEVALPLK